MTFKIFNVQSSKNWFRKSEHFMSFTTEGGTCNPETSIF